VSQYTTFMISGRWGIEKEGGKRETQTYHRGNLTNLRNHLHRRWSLEKKRYTERRVRALTNSKEHGRAPSSSDDTTVRKERCWEIWSRATIVKDHKGTAGLCQTTKRDSDQKAYWCVSRRLRRGPS